MNENEFNASHRRLPRVDVVVVNWRNWRETLNCVEALQQIAYANYHVWVVDNASANGSFEQLRSNQEIFEFSLLQSGVNLGFGGGNNLAIRELQDKAEYVWLLNNDAIAKIDTLSALVKTAESDSRIGAVGSVLKYMHDPTKVQAWGGGRLNFFLGRSRHVHLKSEADAHLDFLTAASVLIRVSALRQVGLFDEDFFLYWEDADLSVRLRNHGWRLAVSEESEVLHQEGESLRENLPSRDRYFAISLVRFFLKHSRFGWWSIAMSVATRIASRLATGQLARVSAVIGGTIKGFRDYYHPSGSGNAASASQQ